MKAAIREEGSTLVAVYRRPVRASLERIWENVLDWEHLPWLHRRSFSAIRLLDASREGWRAVVTPRSMAGSPQDSTVEVELHRPRHRYVTRTIAGAGEGAEILTILEPAAERESRIRVEFRLAGVDPQQAAEAGAGHTRLYTRLWDEDEAMMIRRQQVLDDERALLRRERSGGSPPPVPLGPVERLRADLPRVIEAGGRRWRLVELDGELVAHAAVCPHRGGPLEASPVKDGCLTCPWHGYRYDLATGRCLDHPTIHLDSPPRVVIDPETGDASLLFGALS